MRRRLTRGILAGLLFALALPAGAAIVWDQSTLGSGFGGNASQFLPVNDFDLAHATTLDGFSVWLSDSSPDLGGDGVADAVFSSFSGVLSWYVFADAASLPGALLASGSATGLVVVDTGIDLVDEDVFRVDGEFGAGLDLDAGTYWFGVREGAPGAATDSTGIRWLGSSTQVGAFAKLFLDGAAIANLNEAPNSDGAFLLTGHVADVPEPGTWAVLTLGLLALRCRVRRDR